MMVSSVCIAGSLQKCTPLSSKNARHAGLRLGVADHGTNLAGAAIIDTTRTFAANATAAKEFRGDPSNAEICRLAKLRGHKIEPSHLGRIFAGKHSPRLSYVAAIAAALDYPVWQLLVPNFAPSNPPRVLTARQVAALNDLFGGKLPPE